MLSYIIKSKTIHVVDIIGNIVSQVNIDFLLTSYEALCAVKYLDLTRFYCVLAALLMPLMIMASVEAGAQNKFFSTSSRGGAEGAKQNAQMTAFQSEFQRMNACTAAGMIYAPTHVAADADGCTTDVSSRSLSDNLSVGGHMSVSGTLTMDERLGIGITPQLPLDVAGAMRIAGETETCTADKAGSMRYNPAISQIEFCNGTNWGGMGGSGGGAFSICDGTDITSQNCDPTQVIGVSCSYTGQTFSASTASYSASWIGLSGGRWVMWDNGTQASSISGMHSCGQVLTYMPGGGSSGGGGGGGSSSGSGVPSGAVMAFNLSLCPSGWSPVTAAQGRFIVGTGTLGSDSYNLGATGGSAHHTLTIPEMPVHDHGIGTYGLVQTTAGNVYGLHHAYATGSATKPAGGGQPHENRPPYLALLYCQKD